MKDSFSPININNNLYLKVFFYFIYLSFLANYLYSTKISEILYFFSEFGTYFASTIILSCLTLWLIKKEKKVETSNLLIFSLLLSHIFTFFHINKTIFSFTSNLLHLHIFFIAFCIALIILAIGIYLLSKFDKRLIFFPIGILFVYTVYFVMQWHSFNQQKQIFLDFYTVAVDNNIQDLKECGTKVACIRTLPNGDLSLVINNFKTTSQDQESQTKIKDYLIWANEKIKDKKENTFSLSYLDNFTIFKDDIYQPLAMINKKNQLFLVDFHNSKIITDRGYDFYKKITGTSSVLWILFMHLLFLFHYLYKMRKSRANK
jgi:hypothetical protein